MDVPAFALVAIAYALFGGSLSAFYIYCERLRREPPVHILTVVLTFFATLLTVLALSFDAETIGIVEKSGEQGVDLEAWVVRVLSDAVGVLSGGVRLFAFLVAALFYVPCFVFLGVHYSGLALDRILVPGTRGARPDAPQTPKEWWDLLRGTLERLSEEPNNVRLRLRVAGIYRRLGYYDSAAYEYNKASEWIGRGYAHSHVLYKAAYTLAEQKHDLARALPILRRIVRLYPKSYFASYARRVISRYDAHRGRIPGSKADTRRKPM